MLSSGKFKAAAVASVSAVAVLVGLTTALAQDRPITLPTALMETASVFEGYMRRAADVDARFTTPVSVAGALRVGAGYQPRQMEQGMIAYAAQAALTDPRFVAGVQRASTRGTTPEAMLAQLIANPNSVLAVDGAESAARRAQVALLSRSGPVITAGRQVKQSAYDIQHQAWSSRPVANTARRLAEVKTLSTTPQRPILNAVYRLPPSETGSEQPAGRPITMVTVRALALAAAAVLGANRPEDAARLEPLLSDFQSADCLRMSKLNLYQCLAVAKPNYEDVFCLGQHVLIDTGQCVANAAGGLSAAPALPPSQIAATPAPGSAIPVSTLIPGNRPPTGAATAAAAPATPAPAAAPAATARPATGTARSTR